MSSVCAHARPSVPNNYRQGASRLSCRPSRFRGVRVDCLASEAAVIQGPHLTYKTAHGVDVHILGVEHCIPQPHLGDFILQRKPHAVVLETSLTREHGTRTGNVITPTDRVEGHESFFFRMFLAMAARLQDESDPITSETWAQTKGQLFGEQIAYVAAFTMGAKLIFGDRPKEITYRRLLHMTSVEELDRVFAQQSAWNYWEVIHDKAPVEDVASSINRVMMTERDAVLCSSLDAAAADAQRCGGQCVVGLVGEAHLAGMKQLWESGEWRDVVERQPDSSAGEQAWQASVWTAPSESAQSGSPDQIGVKRALLECVVRLRCTDSVIQDMMATLGPVPEDQREAHEATHEIYSTSRMLMAVLDRELLEQVVSGYQCDFWEVLEPLRRIRPSNGGPGWSRDLLIELRGLNFQLD